VPSPSYTTAEASADESLDGAEMKAVLEPVTKPATPDYVLSVIVDWHRQQCEGLSDPEAEPAIKLTFESTVEDWRMASDLLPWQELAQTMNSFWHIERSDAEWKKVLVPANEHRLGEVCDFIAQTARMEVLVPSGFLGATCNSAGAFRSVRSKLAAAGADVSQLRPSSPLEPYMRKYFDVFLNEILAMAPGSLPVIKPHVPLYYWSLYSAGLCLLATLVAYLFGAIGIAVISWVLFLASQVMIWIVVKLPPNRVELGELKTFRDLAQAIAIHHSANPAN
jgi:hypothetical protein